MRILTGLLALVAVAAAPPTSKELRARYGTPDAERFAVCPDLTLSVEYGDDGYTCALRIEQPHDFYHSLSQGPAPSMEELTDVMNEVVLAGERGKEIGPGPYLWGHFPGTLPPTEYENVTINLYYGWSDKQPTLRGMEAYFKRAACESFQPKRIPKLP